MDTPTNKRAPPALPARNAAPAAAFFRHVENCCTLTTPSCFLTCLRYPCFPALTADFCLGPLTRPCPCSHLHCVPPTTQAIMHRFARRFGRLMDVPKVVFHFCKADLRKTRRRETLDAGPAVRTAGVRHMGPRLGPSSRSFLSLFKRTVQAVVNMGAKLLICAALLAAVHSGEPARAWAGLAHCPPLPSHA